MGSESEKKIPKIKLPKRSDIKRGSKEWNELCKRVRDACEEYGCFEVVYDKISSQLRNDVFSLIRPLFELPLEIKQKNINPKPYHSYGGISPLSPLYESFGIQDASNYDSLIAFSHLLISDPLSRRHFCKIVSSMVEPVDELHDTIRNLILDSYGVGGKEESTTECKTLVRVMKYKPPNSPQDNNNLGLYAHTDKLVCTLICEDEISSEGSLEVQTKNEEWIQWYPSSPNSFIFLVGDPLMAWSNGRLHAVKHRVVMKGEKDRYSLAAFLVPVEGTIIKPQKELIDEHHPQLFKEFDFMDFLNFSSSTEGMAMDSSKILSAFVGI